MRCRIKKMAKDRTRILQEATQLIKTENSVTRLSLGNMMCLYQSLSWRLI